VLPKPPFEIKISHPYFERVVRDGDGYRVHLREDFPVQTFLVLPDTPIWEGYIEMTSDLGFVHEDGNVDWIHGSGQNEVDAVESACQMFLNLVVASDGLSNDDFVRSSLH
jgi:hypothetical protein